MEDEKKTKGQLLNELAEMRQRITELEKIEAKSRRMEQTLKRATELHTAVFNSTTDAISIVDVHDYRIVAANRAFLERHGLSEEHAVGMTCYEVTHNRSEPCTPPDDICPLVDAVRSGAHSVAEHVHYSKDGERIYVEVSASPIRDASGNIVQVVHVARDITERRRVEKQIRREKEFTSSLLQGLKEGLAVVDQEGMQILVNAELCNMTGYSEEELLWQKPPFAYWAEEGLKSINETFEKTLKGVEGEYELIFKRKDGERFIALVSPRATTDPDGNTIFFATVKDITEQKRAEEALQETEQRYRRLLDTMNEALAEADENHLYTFANDRFCEMLGYSRDEVIGRHPTDFLDEASKQIFEEQRARHKGSKRARYELEFIAKDGHKIPTITSTHRIFDADGNYRGSVAVFVDITERKRMEQQLKEYSENLERMVEERTRELKDAIEKIVRTEKLAAIGELAGGVSHELRNPLAAIKASAYFLKVKMGDAADEKMTRHLDMVERQMDACVKIISDLLDFARPGKTTIEEIDINQVIQRVVQATALPQGIEISTSLAANLPPVLADAGQMEQVFSNLVTNAIQAMPDGGRLSLSTSQSDSFIEVVVADTGVGIPQENLCKVFEPLFTTKIKGVGLGLAIVKRLLERQSGTIEVHSQVGKGTTFTVKLPIAGEGVPSHEQSERPGR